MITAPAPDELEKMVLRRETLERILAHVQQGEYEKAEALLTECLDFETRRHQYGAMMRAWRRLREAENTEDESRLQEEYRQALDKFL